MQRHVRAQEDFGRKDAEVGSVLEKQEIVFLSFGLSVEDNINFVSYDVSDVRVKVYDTEDRGVNGSTGDLV